MIGGQAFVSFLIWILYGSLQARRAPALRPRLAALSRSRRALLGPVLMIGGASALLGAIAIVSAFNGLSPTGLKLWAWAIVTLAGLVFVHAQSLAAVMMVSLATETEPTGSGRASEGRITDRNSDEAKTPSRP